MNICGKPKANIFNDERLDAFIWRYGTKQGYLVLPLLFENVLEILAKTIIQEKAIKCLKIG